MVGAWVFGVENMVYRAMYVLVWHALADFVTKTWPTPTGGTTIRRADKNGEKGYKEHGKIVHFAIFWFSFSQLIGTFMMIADTENCVRMAMFVMAPVQLSAFFATLVRKGYTRSETSFVMYWIILTPIMYYHHWAPIEALFVAAVGILRFKLRMNKYVMWIGVAALFSYLSGDLALAVGRSELAPPVLPSWAWARVQPASVFGSILERTLGINMPLKTPGHSIDTVYDNYVRPFQGGMSA